MIGRHTAEMQSDAGMYIQQPSLLREEENHDNKHRRPAKGGKPAGVKSQDPGRTPLCCLLLVALFAGPPFLSPPLDAQLLALLPPHSFR